uniref:Uncharacterized protein n=1 Tax=Arundo donax TaxID=35708 RepID=A0A0A9G3S4_ARUDO
MNPIGNSTHQRWHRTSMPRNCSRCARHKQLAIRKMEIEKPAMTDRPWMREHQPS